MRRARAETQQAEMGAPTHTEQWPVANVVLQQYEVQVAVVDILNNDGNWVGAHLGHGDVFYGRKVGVRARAKNLSPVTAFCTITSYLVRPDGSKGIAASWSGNVAPEGLTGFSSFEETANQLGLYNSINVAVISTKV